MSDLVVQFALRFLLCQKEMIPKNVCLTNSDFILCVSLGHLGQSSTNRNNPICAKSTKMAKRITIQSDSCDYCTQFQEINISNVYSRLYITIYVLKIGWLVSKQQNKKITEQNRLTFNIFFRMFLSNVQKSLEDPFIH